jgi:hypothetical protein
VLRNKGNRVLLACCFLLLAHWAMAQVPRYSGSFNWNNRFYFYTLDNDGREPEKWDLTLSVVSQLGGKAVPESNKVFSTEALLQMAGQRITHLRIYGSTPLDYAWAVSRSEYYETAFQWTGGRVVYMAKGRKMGSPAYRKALAPAEQVDRFAVGELGVAEGVRLAIVQFVKQYEGLFRFPDGPPPTGREVGQLVAGQMEVQGQQYNYEVRRSFFNPGDDNLSIRKQGQGLVYNTLMKIAENDSAQTVSIDIHHVQLSGLSWLVFANDIWRAKFDLAKGTIAWEKFGTDMKKDETSPDPQPTFAVQPGQRPPLDELIRITVQNLIVQYHPAFVR